MRLLSRATGSALQALGDPNDPAAAFAQDFLGSVMSGLPMPQARPAAARDAREATLALLDETFGNTARDPRDTLLLAAGPDAGVWTESLSRSFDFGRGYAEGSGMSLLQTGEAIAAVARNPGQFIDGVRALITSSQARQQLGEAIINRINYDLREFNHAYNTGDWRRAGQQFGLMVNALTQAAGGAQGLTRGAQAAARGGARLAGRGLEALADAVANAKPATARLRQTGGVRIPSAAEINEVIARYGDIGARFTHVFKNPEHLLRDFVLRYGNESAAFAAIDRAAQQLAGTPGVVITRWIQVEGTPIWVRGNTVNGRFRISTFSANVDNTKYPYSP